MALATSGPRGSLPKRAPSADGDRGAGGNACSGGARPGGRQRPDRQHPRRDRHGRPSEGRRSRGRVRQLRCAPSRARPRGDIRRRREVRGRDESGVPPREGRRPRGPRRYDRAQQERGRVRAQSAAMARAFPRRGRPLPAALPRVALPRRAMDRRCRCVRDRGDAGASSSGNSSRGRTSPLRPGRSGDAALDRCLHLAGESPLAPGEQKGPPARARWAAGLKLQTAIQQFSGTPAEGFEGKHGPRHPQPPFGDPLDRRLSLPPLQAVNAPRPAAPGGRGRGRGRGCSGGHASSACESPHPPRPLRQWSWRRRCGRGGGPPMGEVRQRGRGERGRDCGAEAVQEVPAGHHPALIA